MQSTARSRILGTLSYLLFSRERPLEMDTPLLLHTLYHGMFSLLFDLASTSGTDSECESIAKWMLKVRDGECGALTREEFEREYGVRYSSKDNEQAIREATMAEAVAKCLEIGSERSRRWALQNLVKVGSSPKASSNASSIEYIRDFGLCRNPSSHSPHF